MISTSGQPGGPAQAAVEPLPIDRRRPGTRLESESHGREYTSSLPFFWPICQANSEAIYRASKALSIQRPRQQQAPVGLRARFVPGKPLQPFPFRLVASVAKNQGFKLRRQPHGVKTPAQDARTLPAFATRQH